ncbi:hypothetical protein L7F22_068613 [Adiantum nelumboides]|nr:hypothetical protein [Adiantum nelumboides]
MRLTMDKMCCANGIQYQSLQSALGDLQQEKYNTVERLAQMTLEFDDLKQEKSPLRQKLSIFSSLVEAQDAEQPQNRDQGDQLVCLLRHVSHSSQKLVKQDEDNLNLKKQVVFLEAKLQEKVDALSKIEKQLKALETSGSVRSSMAFKEVLELRQQLELLQVSNPFLLISLISRFEKIFCSSLRLKTE